MLCYEWCCISFPLWPQIEWFKTTEMYYFTGGQKSDMGHTYGTKIKVLEGPCFLQTFKGQSVPRLFQLLVAASIPLLVASPRQSLPLWYQCLLLCV